MADLGLVEGRWKIEKKREGRGVETYAAAVSGGETVLSCGADDAFGLGFVVGGHCWIWVRWIWER